MLRLKLILMFNRVEPKKMSFPTQMMVANHQKLFIIKSISTMGFIFTIKAQKYLLFESVGKNTKNVIIVLK